jgi:hypothetical protein
MKLKELLNEETLKILSEESVQLIDKAVTDKISLAVETALSTQDEEYAVKLKKLLEAVDKDCTIKLKRVVEAIDKSSVRKLKMVVSKYNRVLNEDAKKFKGNVVNSISQFIDQYINDAIPADAINEAVKNKTATNVLKNLRSVLAVDTMLMRESVRDALSDGKAQIDELRRKLDKTSAEKRLIKEEAEKAQVALVLERKTSGMSPTRKKHILKTLSDKPLVYIEENFDYAKDLIIKNEKKSALRQKDEAFKKRTIQSDVIVEQSTNSTPEEVAANPYIQELKKFK